MSTVKGNDSNTSSGLRSSEHTKHSIVYRSTLQESRLKDGLFHPQGPPLPSYETPRVLCHMLMVSFPRPQGPSVVLLKEQFCFLPEMPVCFILFPRCLHQSKNNTVYSLKGKEPSKSQNEFAWKHNHTVTLNH